MTLVEAAVDGRVGRLRLRRGEKRNALSHALVDEAMAAMDHFAEAGVAVAVLEADPPVFCAGNDLEEARANPDAAAAPRFLDALLTRRLTWIAAIEGPALGAGVAVAAVCPIAIATPAAWFALPEHRIGLFPAGVVAYLEPLLGVRACLELGVTGKPMAAEDAARRGLISEVAAPVELAGRVQGWTDRLLANAQVNEAARRSWQGRFTTPAAVERAEQLEAILRGQSIAVPEIGASG